MEQVKVIFLPFKISAKGNKGETIIEVARRVNIPIESVCGGKGECGKCKIKILTPESTSKITEKEKKLIEEKDLADGIRLACVAKIAGNLTVEVPQESIVSGFVREKTRTQGRVALQPSICVYVLKVPPPSLSDNESDIERVKRTLNATYNVFPSKIDPLCFKHSSSILRQENWNVGVVVWEDEEILDIRPKGADKVYGVAIDIGTTTIGAYLLSLKDGSCLSSSSILNPQIRFGDDIMSRISYIAQNGIRGLEILNEILIVNLNSLIENLSQKAGISKEDIFEVTIVGNTVMHHIFLRINPLGLGVSPFVPHFSSSITLKARDMGIRINPSANIHVLPIEAGFVGADNVGVVLALKPYLQDEYNLIIDIGTNGEIVLGNKERLVSASCATGPALEGAHVKFGMRADIGAIERIRIDAKSKEVEYTVIGNGKPKGICGSGVIDAVSELFKTRVIDRSGRFKEDANSKRLRKTSGIAEFVIAWAEETSIGKDITITQEDIRNVQFAKAAIYAGAKILLRHLGIERPSKVMLAGAFGNYIDIKNAYVLGLFPSSRLSDIIPVGNAAGEGAIFALLNRKEREEAERIARKIEYLELTLCKEFHKEFLDALYIPHKIDPFPDLDDLLKDYL